MDSSFFLWWLALVVAVEAAVVATSVVVTAAVPPLDTLATRDQATSTWPLNACITLSNGRQCRKFLL